MATIVQHHSTGHRFVLIGAGFGMYKATRPHLFWGDWAQHEDGGTLELLCVCGTDGEVGWVASKEVTVLSVDGKSPHDHLVPVPPYR